MTTAHVQSGSEQGPTPVDGRGTRAGVSLVMEQPLLRSRGSDEWLLTNGLGGFAMGTSSGVPQRRYHAWLIGATRPPVGRVVGLSACVEALVVRKAAADATDQPFARYELSTFAFCDPHAPVMSPNGLSRLVKFAWESGSCAWTYRVCEDGVDVTITRRLLLHRHRNALSVVYDVAGQAGFESVGGLGGVGGREAYLEIRPLVAMRDFHDLVEQRHTHQYQCFDIAGPGRGGEGESRGVRVVARGAVLQMALGAGVSGRFAHDVQWWNDFAYQKDARRGQGWREHLLSPGCFVVPVRGAQRVELFAALEQQAAGLASFDDALTQQRERIAQLAAQACAGTAPKDVKARRIITQLVGAGDAFVVTRQDAGNSDDALTSIIAGYPWFSDWGRDTCIALPGLLLATGRNEEALRALRAFAGLRRRGLIPNCFDNGTGAPEYNTVDASLWFIVAACRYLRATGDVSGFESGLRQACLDIIDAYRAGTDYGIGLDAKDGLLTAGDASSQLTWMDAKRDGVVFTPRAGKAVEVNALWYASLMMLSAAIEQRTPRTARELQQLAHRCAAHFEGAFWHSAHACLHDVAYASRFEMRPNQIFAAALEFSPLSAPKRRAVLEAVRHFLLVPEGVRTLAPGWPGYQPRYEGTLFERDGAYHNGTVWPWLLGPFCEGLMRAEEMSGSSKEQARSLLEGALATLRVSSDPHSPSQPLGSVCEILDAEDYSSTHGPGGQRRCEGCPMQAWSVAEVLRVYVMATQAYADGPR